MDNLATAANGAQVVRVLFAVCNATAQKRGGIEKEGNAAPQRRGSSEQPVNCICCMQTLATCCDYRHPPDNVLEPEETKFWATTGGYPQEIVIDLGGVVQVCRSIQLGCASQAA